MFGFIRKNLIEDKGFFLILLGLYSIVCYIHLNTYCDAPLFDYPIIDNHENIVEGLELASNGIGSTGNPYFHSPFYIWVLAVLFKFLVPHPAFIIVFQFGLHFLSAILLYTIGQFIFSKFVARLSMAFFLFYGPAIFYASQIMNPTIIIFINLSLILFLITNNSFSFAKWCILGLLAGISFITRSDILIFLVSALVWFCLKYKPYRKAFFAKLSVVLCFFLIPLLFTGLMNYRKSQQFELLPVNGFINLYFGNNPDYKNTIGIRPGKMYYEIYKIPDESRKRPQDPGRYVYLERVYQFANSSPVEFIKCQAYKAYTLVNGYELPETFDMYSQRQYSWVLKLSICKSDFFNFPFGLILPLALCGLFFIRRKDRSYSLMLIYIASYAFILVVLWNSSISRLPMVPFLIILSAAYIESLFTNTLKVILQRLAIALLLIILTNITYDHFSRTFDYNLEIFKLIRMVHSKR